MTANDFNPGETWTNDRGRKLEIVATHVIETDYDTVHVIAFTFSGHRMVHIRAAIDTMDWTKESE